MTTSWCERAVEDLAQIQRPIRPPLSALANTSGRDLSRPSEATGVGTEPVDAITDVRSADARCRKRDTPEGVVHSFHVSVYKVEPRACSRSCNLLSKHCCRPALADEVEESWPEVPLIVKPSSFTCRAERLARARTSPHGSIIRPSGKSQGVSPPANPCEEMTLSITAQVSGLNVLNASLIHFSCGDQAHFNQCPELGGHGGVELVVVVHHATALYSLSRKSAGLNPSPRITASDHRTGLARSR